MVIELGGGGGFGVGGGSQHSIRGCFSALAAQWYPLARALVREREIRRAARRRPPIAQHRHINERGLVDDPEEEKGAKGG